MKILYFVPGIESDGATAQLAVLARGLARRGCTVRVCALGALPSALRGLQDVGIATAALGPARPLDPRPLLRLRRLLHEFRPDLVHACRPACLRALAMAGGRASWRLVLSHPLAPARRPDDVPARWDRWLLGRVDAIAAANSSEASRCVRAGISIGRVSVVPSGLEPVRDGAVRAGSTGEDSGHRILCAGRLEAHKGHRDAVWALDILRHIRRDLRLVVAGDGPERRRLTRFCSQLSEGDSVAFPGTNSDVPALMSAADVVWVPSLADGGTRVALEAMAAGKAVIASRLPGLAEVVRDGETGLLIPPGDTVALARVTLRLLEDDGLRAELGEAGRRRVASHFTAGQAVQAASDLYGRLAA